MLYCMMLEVRLDVPETEGLAQQVPGLGLALPLPALTAMSHVSM
jgi:hypothetical protein